MNEIFIASPPFGYFALEASRTCGLALVIATAVDEKPTLLATTVSAGVVADRSAPPTTVPSRRSQAGPPP